MEYVLKTKFGSYVSGVVRGSGMITNDADDVDHAMRWGTVQELVAWLRSRPALAVGEQNKLSIHRVGPQPEPVLNDLGEVG